MPKDEFIWKPKIDSFDTWYAPSDEEIKRLKKISVVVYAPKYDEKLREEAEVIMLEDGKFSVEITRLGKRKYYKDLGTFDSYEEAKESLLESFNDFFNRPSKNAIKHGANPNWRVWDVDMHGNPRHWNSPAQEVKRSISIIESEEEKVVFGARVESITTTPSGKMKSYTIRIPDTSIPSEITIKKLYPAYFKHKKISHAKRIRKLSRKVKK